MKFLLMARALFAGLGIVRRDSTYSTCAVSSQSRPSQLLPGYIYSLCKQRTCIDENLAAVSTAGCTVTSSPLGCLCSSANLEGDILDCMQDLCPDSIDFAGVSDFLDQFCIGLSTEI